MSRAILCNLCVMYFVHKRRLKIQKSRIVSMEFFASQLRHLIAAAFAPSTSTGADG